MIPSTPGAYDAALAAIRSHAEDLAAWLAIWEARREPDAHARRCVSDAVDAIDSMLRELHAVRGAAAPCQVGWCSESSAVAET